MESNAISATPFGVKPNFSGKETIKNGIGQSGE